MALSPVARTVCLAVAALGVAAWALPIMGLGGTSVDLAVPGLVLASLALGAGSPLPGPRGVAAAAVLLTVVGFAYNTRAAVCSDPYGYVSQADLWLQGNLKISLPWLAEVPWPEAGRSVAPMGYGPVASDPAAIAPTYSIGLPLLMALAKALGGQIALYAVPPLAAGLLVWGTWRLGQALGYEREASVAGLLIAASAAVLFMSVWPMSDVPAAAAWVWAFAWCFTPGLRAAACSGLAAGLAVLIRPNLVFGAGALGLYYLADWLRRRDRPHFVRGLLFAVGVGLAGLLVGLVNHSLYGSFATSGYGDVSGYFWWANVPRNALQYTRWLCESQTPLVLLVLWPGFWPVGRDRLQFLPVALFSACLCLHYCLYVVFDAWWYLRFFLPLYPFLMLALARLFSLLLQKQRQLGLAALSLYCLWGWHSGRAAFWIGEHERSYISMAQRLQARLPENSLTMCGLHSGTLRFYAGRNTMRFDFLAAGWLDRCVEFFRSRGVALYLYLTEWEVDQFQRTFAGEKWVHLVEQPPLYEVIHPNTGRERLWRFDAPGLSTEREALTFERLPWALPPQPVPPLRLLDLQPTGGSAGL